MRECCRAVRNVPHAKAKSSRTGATNFAHRGSESIGRRIQAPGAQGTKTGSGIEEVLAATLNMPTRHARQGQRPEMLRIQQQRPTFDALRQAAVNSRQAFSIRRQIGHIVRHQQHGLGHQVARRVQRQLKQGMTEHMHPDAAAPGVGMRMEQAFPVVPIPQLDKPRITAQHNGAGLIEMGQRTLASRALTLADAGNVLALTQVEGALGARPAQPDQGIEEIVPIALAGGEPPEPDALFVVQSIGQQFRILRDKPWPRDAITRGCRAPQTLKLIKAWPMATADETRKCEVNIEQGRAQEGCTVDILDGRYTQSQGFGQWLFKVGAQDSDFRQSQPRRRACAGCGYHRQGTRGWPRFEPFACKLTAQSNPSWRMPGDMAEMLRIAGGDMHCIGAYRAMPTGSCRGGLVIMQEIFGVNAHIRALVEGFAAAGYCAIAPALFDHIENDVELDYDSAGIARGRALIAELSLDDVIADVGSAANAIASAGKIGVVGYCWGGTIALLSAIRLGLPAVSYYGSRNVAWLDQACPAPLQFHFGANDASIPPEAIERHRKAYPHAEVHVYPAGHGFNCDLRADFDPASATLARQRTLEFLARHLGPSP